MLAILAAAAALMVMDDTLTVSAAIGDAPLEAQGTFEVAVEMRPGAGWTADSAGLPGYVVQLDVPDSVTPTGKVLTELRELARNGLQLAPYERLVKDDEASIEFTLLSEPGSTDQIAVNVLCYLTHEDGRATFARRRVEVSVSPGAAGESSEPASVSDWGLEAAGLQIGDHAPDVLLPTKDGEDVSLGERFAESDVILTTYRAFW